MFSKRDKSVLMSAPEVRTLHGVEIKKLPIGRYIQLLRHAEGFLPDVLTAVFPDGKVSLSVHTIDEITGLLSRALAVVPEKLCEVCGELLGVPADMLLNPEEGLTPGQLAEILVALWEANDVNDFFMNVRKLGSLIGLSAPIIGSSDG